MEVEATSRKTEDVRKMRDAAQAAGATQETSAPETWDRRGQFCDRETMNGKLILEQADLLDSNEEDEEDVLKKQLEDIRYIRRVLQDESTLFSKMVYVHGNILDTMLMEAVQQARCGDVAAASHASCNGATSNGEGTSNHVNGEGPARRAARGAKFGLDVFGQDVNGASVEFVECKYCGRRVTANRFVPHLEKCIRRDVVGVEYNGTRRRTRQSR